MDSLVTQGLVVLVFVLSIALWSKSSQHLSTSKSDATSSSQKNKKKKKSNTATLSTPSPVAPSTTSSALTSTITLSDYDTLSSTSKAPPSIKSTPPAHQSNGKSNGNVSKAGKGALKKMKLEEFVAKTNEERVEESEREARGNADEKDLGKDMIDKDLQPEVSYKKFARIEPASQIKSYAAVSAEEGWESVGGKAKAPTPITASTKASNVVPSNAWASSNPFALLPGSGAEPVRASVPITSNSATTSSKTNGSASAAAAQAQTKRQRQNAAKTQAKKAEREAMEEERLARLAQHKREVEAERIKEFYKKQTAPSKPFSTHSQSAPSSKVNSKASVNEKGSLVWD